MKHFANRDLLVVNRQPEAGEEWLQEEVDWLNQVLDPVESLASLCTCCELIDLNRYRITRKAAKLKKALSLPEPEPFRFVFNLN